MDGVIRRTLSATAPLLVWAAHFTLCYLLVAAECSPALHAPGARGVWILAAATVAALLACGIMLWRADLRRGDLADWSRAGSAALAIAAIAWGGVPLLLLDGCG
jgi:hypothetical protein